MMDDDNVQRGQRWLEDFLTLALLPVVSVQSSIQEAAAEGEASLFESASIWLTIDDQALAAEQVNALIGQNGAHLDAIQYLANTILNLGRAADMQSAYTVELAGYRLRRQAELKALAEEAVEQVRLTGEEFEIENLSSAERRQLHTFLKDFNDLETYSRGKEPDRRLVVQQLTSEEEA